MPWKRVPSGSVADASMAAPSLVARHLPSASKFSSENPSGSILTWQTAHDGFLRCASICARIELALALSASSLSGGTSGGGGGGGAPSTLSSSHRPRNTGEVRFGYEVTVRMLPCP